MNPVHAMLKSLAVSSSLIALQLVLGCASFFVFFAAMFNGLTGLMIGAALAGVGANLVVSYFAAKRSMAEGVAAALLFGTPALLFAVFALGDLLMQRDAAPFVFWLTGAAAAISAGLLGVALARRAR
jgi:hypothetical protein